MTLKEVGLLFMFYFSCPIVGCDIGWFEPQRQDKCSSRNDSMDSFVKEANSTESSRHDVSTVRSCPHDVRYTGVEESLDSGETVNTENLNTYPANESVGTLFFDKCTNDITRNSTIEPDLGYTFVLDILGTCFNVTVIEANRERIDYDKMIAKLEINVNFQETIDSEQDETKNVVHSDTMTLSTTSNFVAQISENNSRLINVTSVLHIGRCTEFGIRRKVGE
ncbi:uncharacterized protein LOC131934831 [Physella acuta]|uniref:uncharacterized protein LOC131934831 n=1 Tax=Physella acuta TaxID=109671 RepID=UPI0027DC30A7|nr:uncharacterized protein LOC131934831 [Physella acuta]